MIECRKCPRDENLGLPNQRQLEERLTHSRENICTSLLICYNLNRIPKSTLKQWPGTSQPGVISTMLFRWHDYLSLKPYLLTGVRAWNKRASHNTACYKRHGTKVLTFFCLIAIEMSVGQGLKAYWCSLFLIQHIICKHMFCKRVPLSIQQSWSSHHLQAKPWLIEKRYWFDLLMRTILFVSQPRTHSVEYNLYCYVWPPEN